MNFIYELVNGTCSSSFGCSDCGISDPRLLWLQSALMQSAAVGADVSSPSIVRENLPVAFSAASQDESRGQPPLLPVDITESGSDGPNPLPLRGLYWRLLLGHVSLPQPSSCFSDNATPTSTSPSQDDEGETLEMLPKSIRSTDDVAFWKMLYDHWSAELTHNRRQYSDRVLQNMINIDYKLQFKEKEGFTQGSSRKKYLGKNSSCARCQHFLYRNSDDANFSSSAQDFKNENDLFKHFFCAVNGQHDGSSSGGYSAAAASEQRIDSIDALSNTSQIHPYHIPRENAALPETTQSPLPHTPHQLIHKYMNQINLDINRLWLDDDLFDDYLKHTLNILDDSFNSCNNQGHASDFPVLTTFKQPPYCYFCQRSVYCTTLRAAESPSSPTAHCDQSSSSGSVEATEIPQHSEDYHSNYLLHIVREILAASLYQHERPSPLVNLQHYAQGQHEIAAFIVLILLWDDVWWRRARIAADDVAECSESADESLPNQQLNQKSSVALNYFRKIMCLICCGFDEHYDQSRGKLLPQNQYLAHDAFFIFMSMMSKKSFTVRNTGMPQIKAMGLSEWFLPDESSDKNVGTLMSVKNTNSFLTNLFNNSNSLAYCYSVTYYRHMRSVDRLLFRELALYHDIHPAVFMVRWLRALFLREFTPRQVTRIWDIMIAEHSALHRPPGESIALWVAVSMLIQVRKDLLGWEHTPTFCRLMRYAVPPDTVGESPFSQIITRSLALAVPADGPEILRRYLVRLMPSLASIPSKIVTHDPEVRERMMKRSRDVSHRDAPSSAVISDVDSVLESINNSDRSDDLSSYLLYYSPDGSCDRDSMNDAERRGGVLRSLCCFI